MLEKCVGFLKMTKNKLCTIIECNWKCKQIFLAKEIGGECGGPWAKGKMRKWIRKKVKRNCND